jgi:hypothetical protein
MSQQPHPVSPQQTPGVADAEQGQVILDGPNGIAVTFTPDAATGTGHSLLAAAERARSQRDGQTKA